MLSEIFFQVQEFQEFFLRRFLNNLMEIEILFQSKKKETSKFFGQFCSNVACFVCTKLQASIFTENDAPP